MKSEKTGFDFCPYKEVVIERVSSELLEKIGALPLLILLQISKIKQLRILQTASVCKSGSSVMQQRN